MIKNFDRIRQMDIEKMSKFLTDAQDFDVVAPGWCSEQCPRRPECTSGDPDGRGGCWYFRTMTLLEGTEAIWRDWLDAEAQEGERNG